MSTTSRSWVAGVVGCVLALASGRAWGEEAGEALAFPTLWDGDFIVVWEVAAAREDTDIYGRRYSAHGAPLGEPFVVAASAAREANPRVARSWVDDELLVVWERQSSRRDADLVARRFTSDGDPLGPLLTIAEGREDEVEAEVGFSEPLGEYLVTWSAVRGRGQVVRRARLLASDGGGSSGAFEWNEESAARLSQSWIATMPIPIPEPEILEGGGPVPTPGSWVLDLSGWSLDPEGRVESSPVPQPVPGGFVMATTIPLPGPGLASATPITLPDPRLVLLTPVPPADPEAWAERPFAELEDPSDLLSSLPLPLPGPYSWEVVASLPVPIP